MKTFFTSDTHFCHSNIIKYCNRPFKSAEEMDKQLIENWNSVVGKDDVVYHLGDVIFHKDPDYAIQTLNKLNGKKILIRGNHDKGITGKVIGCFDRIVPGILEVKIQDSTTIMGKRSGHQSVILCHYAMRVWDKSHHSAWHLYGHSHGTLPEDETLSFDVGVDSWNYKPVSYEEVKEKMLVKQSKLTTGECK